MNEYTKEEQEWVNRYEKDLKADNGGKVPEGLKEKDGHLVKEPESDEEWVKNYNQAVQNESKPHNPFEVLKKFFSKNKERSFNTSSFSPSSSLNQPEFKEDSIKDTNYKR